MEAVTCTKLPCPKQNTSLVEDAPVRPCCACDWLLTRQGGVGGQAAGGLARVQLVWVTVYLVLQDHPAGPRL